MVEIEKLKVDRINRKCDYVDQDENKIDRRTIKAIAPEGEGEQIQQYDQEVCGKHYRKVETDAVK